MKEDPVGLLCSKFYQLITVSPGADPLPGQIVSAHTVYPTDEPWIVKVISYNATDPSRCKYEVKKYEPGDRSHFPIAELNLRQDENFYIYKGKERPLVVVGGVRSRWANPLRDERLFLCAPLFTFKDRHTDRFKIECIGFLHPTLFYLPAETDGCSAAGVVRFEYMQPIAIKALHNYLAGSPSRPVALSDEAFALFLNHLARFVLRKDIDAGVCRDIDAYHELVREQLQK